MRKHLLFTKPRIGLVCSDLKGLPGRAFSSGHTAVIWKVTKLYFHFEYKFILFFIQLHFFYLISNIENHIPSILLM